MSATKSVEMKSNYKIKAVFFDVDGTLLSHRHGSVPISAKTAMHRLRENGNRPAYAGAETAVGM